MSFIRKNVWIDNYNSYYSIHNHPIEHFLISVIWDDEDETEVEKRLLLI